jgi:Phosphoserine phosphatase RsbU, N-terminal domain
MTDRAERLEPLAALRRDYAPPFLSYLAHHDEAGLRAAYELGRRAMSRGIGLLDLVRVHNESLSEVLPTARTVAEAADLAQAAAVYLLEALASFEMAQRGFMEIGVRAERDA